MTPTLCSLTIRELLWFLEAAEDLPGHPGIKERKIYLNGYPALLLLAKTIEQENELDEIADSFAQEKAKEPAKTFSTAATPSIAKLLSYLQTLEDTMRGCKPVEAGFKLNGYPVLTLLRMKISRLEEEKEHKDLMAETFAKEQDLHARLKLRLCQNAAKTEALQAEAQDRLYRFCFQFLNRLHAPDGYPLSQLTRDLLTFLDSLNTLLGRLPVAGLQPEEQDPF